MKCPNCGLFNPEIAQLCDCGYDFEIKTVKSQAGAVSNQQLVKKNPARTVTFLITFAVSWFLINPLFKSLPIEPVFSSGLTGAACVVIALAVGSIVSRISK